MSRSAPFFPFYVDDWLENDAVADMGYECNGIYIKILCLMWKRQGYIPDRDDWCCRVLYLKPSKWKKIRQQLIDEFCVITSENGQFFNKRLLKEIHFFNQKSQKNSKNAQKRWSKNDKKEVENLQKNSESSQKKSKKFQKSDQNSSVTRSKSEGGDNEKVNKINNRTHATAMQPQCYTDTDTDRDLKDQDQGIKEKREKEKTARSKKTIFSPPSEFEISAYSKLKDLNLMGFFDYYESNGWLVGKNKMKDWQAAARGWSRRQLNFSTQKSAKRQATDLHNPPDYVPENQRNTADEGNGIVIDSTATRIK